MQETWVQSLVREIPDATEQLGLGATTTELVLWGLGTATAEPTCPRAYAPQQERPAQREARMIHLESSSCLPCLEKSLCSNEDAAQPRNKRHVNKAILKKRSAKGKKSRMESRARFWGEAQRLVKESQRVLGTKGPLLREEGLELGPEGREFRTKILLPDQEHRKRS